MAFSFILLEELPKKVDSITPYTMALIAKYIARHRLRETQLLDTIAEFLVKKGEYLDSKVRRKMLILRCLVGMGFVWLTANGCDFIIH